MPSPFPGMDPYLERKGLWSEVHSGLILSVQRALTPHLRPKYRAAIERATFTVMLGEVEPVGAPDVVIYETPSPRQATGGAMVMEAPTIEPQTAIVPMPIEFEQSYLEIREVATRRVVTVIEILSHANKQGRRGREQYRVKRNDILASRTNLIEVDLLRAGVRPPIKLNDDDDYIMLVSRRRQRPNADAYLFSVRDRIPTIPVPLKRNEPELTLDLQPLLAELYDAGGYDLAIDYSQPPTPHLDEADAMWAQQLLAKEL